MRKISVSIVFIYVFITLLTLFCMLPLVLVLITSFASERSITLNGYTFFPTEWSIDAYKLMFNPNSNVLTSYMITIIVTLIGSVISVLITYCAGYALANKRCKYRNGLALFFFITMVFNTGLVPWYMISRNLGLYNNIWALIIPSLVFSPFNMFLTRNFIRGIPDSLHESGIVDGAGEMLIAFKIYFPLCMPVLATITLYYGINYWNNYFNAVMLIDDPKKYPLQMLLFAIQSEITKASRVSAGVHVNPPKESFKMAVSIITIGPIILFYPALQKYFIKGMIIGAVKG